MNVLWPGNVLFKRAAGVEGSAAVEEKICLSFTALSSVINRERRRRDYYYVEEKEEGGRTLRLYAFAYVIGTRLTVRYVFYALKLYISNTILIVISAVHPFHKRQEIHDSYLYSIKITTLSTNSLEKKICRFPHT